MPGFVNLPKNRPLEHSYTEENYLKAIFKLQEINGEPVANSMLAKELSVQSASVTDMLKKMAKKKLINYQKSKGVKLTEKGRTIALGIVRKHRLWEVFLVEKLQFGWDEVHEIAEQLEHIQSDRLTDKLDNYLGFPKADPHGDPIPDSNGVFAKPKSVLLSELKEGSQGKFVGVADHSASFLSYLDKSGLALGDTIKVKAIEAFDRSVILQLKAKKEITISHKVATSLLVSD